MLKVLGKGTFGKVCVCVCGVCACVFVRTQFIDVK